MKNKILFIVLQFIISVTLISQWQQVNIFNSTEKIQNLDAVGQSVIWVVSFEAASNIYRTTNSGLNWIHSGSVPEYCYFISAVNSTTAWVSSGLGNIYKTSNGGINWVQQQYSPKNFINRIHFFNENTGYILADAVNDTVGFFYTRNGGNTWIRSSKAPVSNSGTLLVENCGNQLDTNFIWFCGHHGETNYKFYKLTGGFESLWQVHDYGQTGSFRFAVFKDNLNGIAAAYGGQIVITSDGGATWLNKNSAVGTGTLHELIAVPGSNWIIALRGNAINLSRDFCSTWFASNFAGGTPGYGDAFDTNRIWLSYTNGSVIKYNLLAIGISLISNNIPNAFRLMQNYPNPFNPITKIRFAVPSEVQSTGKSNLSVFDVNGKLIKTILDMTLEQGEYEAIFDGSNYSSGIYFYKLTYRDLSAVNKMILVK